MWVFGVLTVSVRGVIIISSGIYSINVLSAVNHSVIFDSMAVRVSAAVRLSFVKLLSSFVNILIGKKRFVTGVDMG